MKADGPESRHLRRVEVLLDEVTPGRAKRCKHPSEKQRREGSAKWTSYRVQCLGWKPGDGWKRPGG